MFLIEASSNPGGSLDDLSARECVKKTPFVFPFAGSRRGPFRAPETWRSSCPGGSLSTLSPSGGELEKAGT